MNGENKTSKIENVKKTPTTSPRVATYKRPSTLQRGVSTPVSVGKPKVAIRAGVPEKQGTESALSVEKKQLKIHQEPKPQTEAPRQERVKVEEPTVKETQAKAQKTEKAKAKARATRKAFGRHKKKRVKQSISPLTAVIVALVSVAVIIGVVIISMYSAGHRYLTASFEDNVSATSYTVTFLGKVSPEGTPVSGTLTFQDGKKAKIELTENGIIRVEYSDGSVYEGGFKDLHKNGKGTYTMSNGDVYTGEFFYDRMWGEGTYLFANGDV